LGDVAENLQMLDMPHKICSREIKSEDLNRIVDLLARGFPNSKREYWEYRVERLSSHSPPAGYPKYGYLLENGASLIGSIFTIFAGLGPSPQKQMRCNIVHWCIADGFRSYGSMLAARAMSHKEVTYIVSAYLTDLIPILEAQGYTKFCSGRFAAVPILSPWKSGASANIVDARNGDLKLPADERQLLQDHAALGCISLVCSAGASNVPFIFLPRRRAGVMRFVRLVYCRELDDFIRFAQPLGRYLLRRGFPLVLIDANGPIAGLVGRYLETFPKKYFKGPYPPRTDEIAYSTRVLFDN
jgi:hypothetical protein